MTSPSDPGGEGEEPGGSVSSLSSTLPLTSRSALLAAAAAVLTVVLGLLAAGLVGGSDSGSSASGSASTRTSAAASSTRPPSSTATPVSATTATPSPTSGAHPTPTASFSTGDDGVVRTGVTGSQQWTVATPVPRPEGVPQAVYSYVLQAEEGSGIDVNAVAPTVMATLNDPRGWGSVDNVSFKQVSDPAQAGFIIKIATPGTVDALCAPLETEGTWDCQIGADVVINSDRWSYGVPWADSLEDYRAYLINHEIGHFLGRQHEECGGAGLRAPVMMQQSKGLGDCVLNPWPTQDGAAG